MKLYEINYPSDCLMTYYATEDGFVLDENQNYVEIYHSTNGYDYAKILTKFGFRLYSIDEIILRSIVGHPIGYNNIKHIDGDTRNNVISNLEWSISDEQWEFIDINGIQKCEYKISNFGGFKNKRRTYYQSCTNSRGYILVKMMTNNGTVVSFPLHRLIAMKFVHNPNESIYTEINHIDGNKTNNYWKNLEWVTHDMNMKHAYDLKMISRHSGENSHLSKISASTVHEICRLFIVYQGRAESVYKKIKETDPNVTLKSFNI